jgi:predicted transposase YbfD/YdcC
MAGKRKQTPSHVKIRKFFHPAEELAAISLLESIEEPREPSLFFRHSLTSVLFMTLVSVICGANDWPKVIAMANGMMPWLSQFVDMSSGVPCERTFVRIFNLIDPKQLEGALLEVASAVRDKIPGEVVSFDGQTARGTADVGKNHKGIHLLHAWSSENGLCLGQLKVDDKSNEITAMPELMDQLDLKGTIVTADAMNTQKATAKKAIEKGADYILPVKENQSRLLEEIRLAFDGFDKDIEIAQAKFAHSLAKAQEHRDEHRVKKMLLEGIPTFGASHWRSELEKVHGRIEERLCTAIPIGMLPSRGDWMGASSIVRVHRIRQPKGKPCKEPEIIYYISSLDPDAKLIGESIKKHWGVENQLHWRLDVVFRQDKSRYRDRVGARNLAVVRKMALQALSRASDKGGIATRQCVAACNPEYRERVIKSLL